MDLETIQGLVAQGWCTEGNQHKEMDSVLALAIADIIFKNIQCKHKFILNVDEDDYPLDVTCSKCHEGVIMVARKD